jgi:hypothetical protein
VTVIVPVPRVRPEPMDADQEAAYRVIEWLFAGSKIVIAGTDTPAKPPRAKVVATTAPKNLFVGFAEQVSEARVVSGRADVLLMASQRR